MARKVQLTDIYYCFMLSLLLLRYLLVVPIESDWVHQNSFYVNYGNEQTGIVYGEVQWVQYSSVQCISVQYSTV